MKLWARRGKWRLWEIREVSPSQMQIEKAAVARRGDPSVGIPYCFTQFPDGTRIFCPDRLRTVQIEEEA